MLGMRVTREIVNLLQAIAHILEVTSSLDDSENRRWYHALARSLSIKLWLDHMPDDMALIISQKSQHLFSLSNAHAL